MMSEHYRNKNILVTGGLGLIGSHICDSLVESGSNVTILDDISRGKIEYLKDQERIKIIKHDIIDIEAVEDGIREIDIVFHAASKVLGIGYSSKNHSEMLLHNDNMTNAFFRFLDKKNIKELIVVSSACIYDDDGPDIIKEDFAYQGIPEKANLGYGWAKRLLEVKSQIWSKENNKKLTIVRPFNIYGERYTWAGEFSQGLPSLVKKVLDNKGTVEIWGSGKQKRNYVYAKDCAELILQIAIANQESGGAFNIGTKDTTSLKELAERMCELYNVKCNFHFRTDMPEGRFIKSADEAKLNMLLPNFKNSLTPLDQGLIKMREWYYNNF
ncbi:MAG: dependent epimerase/dehydratase family protein [Rickettsiaceae bacterium]|jgi:nucleoside-diphosphate-sugar epimerase|nr:dependent epimerase/dehydratase family protein [Rickettsiaceae bacterium]